jgi:nitrate reductase NapA
MTTQGRREFLRASAAASALVALGSRAQAAALDPAGTTWTRSVCRYCGTGCGLHVGARDGKVVAVKGDPAAHNAGFLCVKGVLLPQIMAAPDRLRHPLVRRGDRLVRASWDEAMGLAAARFQEVVARRGPDVVGFYGSGQGLTEETYAANKLFKAGIRTNNVDGNPRLCMASAVAGYTSTYGKDEPMGCYEDLDHADLFLLVGTNTAEAHPVLFRRIAERKRTGRDVKVVVLDPRRTATSRLADLHLSFTPGTDLAILNAMAHVLLAEGLADEDFLAAHAAFGEGAEAGKTLDDYRAFLADYTPERAAAISGARAEDIVTAARWFGARGRTAMSLWTMGLNQRIRGTWANNLVHNLHLLTGKIGLPGSTPFSLTGQPNACGGVRDGGALAHTLPYGRLVANAQHRAQMERLWGSRRARSRPGLASPPSSCSARWRRGGSTRSGSCARTRRRASPASIATAPPSAGRARSWW